MEELRIDATPGALLQLPSVATGMQPELAVSAIAVPVAALMVYTDVFLGRFSTTYFTHRIDAAIEKFDYKSIERNYLLGAIPWDYQEPYQYF